MKTINTLVLYLCAADPHYTQTLAVDLNDNNETVCEALVGNYNGITSITATDSTIRMIDGRRVIEIDVNNLMSDELINFLNKPIDRYNPYIEIDYEIENRTPTFWVVAEQEEIPDEDYTDEEAKAAGYAIEKQTLEIRPFDTKSGAITYAKSILRETSFQVDVYVLTTINNDNIYEDCLFRYKDDEGGATVPALFNWEHDITSFTVDKLANRETY